jgi:hypothetical protein
MTRPSHQSDRLTYIRLRLESLGHIRRSDIKAAFRVSTQQASCDIGAAARKWPELMTYDKSAKHYVLNKRTDEPDARAGSAWLIWYQDQDRPPEYFTGAGAEIAARERYRMVSFAWNCHLFEKIRGHDWDARERQELAEAGA